MADVGSFLEEEHMAIFEGAGVAIVTPFKENGEISFDKLDELIEEQIAAIRTVSSPWEPPENLPPPQRRSIWR